MLRSTSFAHARIRGVNALHGLHRRVGENAMKNHNDSFLNHAAQKDAVNRELSMLLTSPEDMSRIAEGLPGVEFESELPADPITRLFFQVKGKNALFQSSYTAHKAKTRKLTDNPETGAEGDRVALGQRWFLPLHDMCMRLLEGSEKRKRFVIVPGTTENKGVAQVLRNHGLLAGFRDFNNNRAFVCEMKYYQGEPVLRKCGAVRVAWTQGETEWSPLMMRRLTKKYGRSSKVEIAIARTWDGRILDQWQMVNEGVGGTGLVVAA